MSIAGTFQQNYIKSGSGFPVADFLFEVLSSFSMMRLNTALVTIFHQRGSGKGRERGRSRELTRELQGPASLRGGENIYILIVHYPHPSQPGPYNTSLLVFLKQLEPWISNTTSSTILEPALTLIRHQKTHTVHTMCVCAATDST